MEFFSSVVVGRGRGAYSSSRSSSIIRKKEEWIDTKSFIVIKRWVSFVLSRKCPSHLLANTPPNTRRGRQKSKRGAKAPETTATVGDLVATLPDAFDSSRFSRVDVSPPVASVLLPGDFFFARTKKKIEFQTQRDDGEKRTCAHFYACDEDSNEKDDATLAPLAPLAIRTPVVKLDDDTAAKFIFTIIESFGGGGVFVLLTMRFVCFVNAVGVSSLRCCVNTHKTNEFSSGFF